jgi:diguanylate cyclase (GGDEF)-like protein
MSDPANENYRPPVEVEIPRILPGFVEASLKVDPDIYCVLQLDETKNFKVAFHNPAFDNALGIPVKLKDFDPYTRIPVEDFPEDMTQNLTNALFPKDEDEKRDSGELRFSYTKNIAETNFLRLSYTLFELHQQPYCLIRGANITDQVQVAREIEWYSTHDQLTKLLKPEGLEKVKQSLNNDKRESKVNNLGILYLDLDGIKGINDNQGHAAGDEYIRQFAELLKAEFRGIDLIVRAKGSGSDEFIVILRDIDNPQSMAVRDKVNDFRKNHPDFPFSFGMTVALRQDDGKFDFDNAIDTADKLMMTEKEKRHQFHGDQDLDSVNKRLQQVTRSNH